MMKLLFDENLSFRLVGLLADLFPESRHIREVGLLAAEDGVIWEFAFREGFVLVSKDTDFYDRSLLYGAPPKVIWLRTGNCTVVEIADLLRHQVDTVYAFNGDDEATFLALGRR